MDGKYSNKAFSSGEAETNLSTKVDIKSSWEEEEGIVFSWSGLTVTVPERSNRRLCGLLPARDGPTPAKTILNDACGVVRPGEFLAIMGASGAGKSTLLNTLLFRNLSGLKVSGLRLANNKLVTPTSLTAVSAYVQQDDLFIGTLTVREHLTFQALVRMDRDIPDKTRMVKVNEIIQEFGLSKCSDTVIGRQDQGQKGISGGQRKRLSLASEILTNPSIMFCDEPTSGLDSYMAATVVETLSRLASQGRTVICTIHQPSSQIVEMFDKVLLMAEGRTAFLGHVSSANKFLESCGYPCPAHYNPADHWVETLAVVPGKETESRERLNHVTAEFDRSEEGRAVKEMAGTDNSSSVGSSHQKKSPYKASWWKQFTALLWRSFLAVIKDPLIMQVRIAQTVVIALVLGAVYFGQEHTTAGVMSINGALFLIITNMTFANMFAVINVICMELPIFLREHFNGMYRTDVYFITKQLAELPVFIITPIIFVGVIYFMVGLNSEVEKFFIAVGIAELLTQAVVSFGYMISCAAPSVNIALAIGPTILIPLMLFGGLFLQNSTIPVWLEWLKYLSWFMYSNEALLINQWKGVDDIRASQTLPNGTVISTTISGDYIISTQMGFNPDNLMFDVGMLAVLAVGFRVLAFLFLLMKTFRKK